MTRVRSRLYFVSGLLSLCAATVFGGCGSTAEQQIVKDLGVGVSDVSARIAVEFSEKIPLNLNAEQPLGCFGSLSLIPATASTGFRVVADIDLQAFSQEIFLRERTRDLPNGTPLPPFIAGSVGNWSVVKGDSFSTNLHLGTASNSGQAGFSIELPFVDKSFPAGLAVTQDLVDSSGRKLGVATVYGPRMEGTRLVSSGGIFVMADLARFAPPTMDVMGWHRVNMFAANADSGCAAEWQRTDGNISTLGWHRVNSLASISPLGWHRVNGSFDTLGWHRVNGSIEALGWHRVNSVDTLGWHRVNSLALAPDADTVVTGPGASQYRSLRALYRLFERFVSAAREAGSAL